MFKNLMEMLYNKGLAANTDLALRRRARVTFKFLEIALQYIPQTARADAMAEMSAYLNDQVQEWDEQVQKMEY